MTRMIPLLAPTRLRSCPLLRTLTVIAALAAAGPVAAQSVPPAAGEGQGDSLADSARDWFDGLMSDAEPALRQIGPMLRELQAMIGDVTDYQMPEKLPNGDIIIRRRTPQEVTPGDDVPDAVPGLPDPPPGQSIDL